MRVLKIFALAALVTTASSFPLTASAQQAAAAAATGTRVGVIDVGFIFKNHPRMKAEIEAIDKQIKAAEDSINVERESVLKDIEQLRSYREDSAEYKMQEEKIAGRESKLKLDFMRREKEFGEAKAEIIYNVYQEVTTAVQSVSEYYGIEIVLRYSKDEMDPKKPQTVGGGINRDIVYFNPSMDMTQAVMSVVQQKADTNTASRPQQQPTTRR